MPRGVTSQSTEDDAQLDAQRRPTQESDRRLTGSSQERRRFEQRSEDFQGVSLEQCALKGIQLGTNAFVLPHGWVAGNFLLQFHEQLMEHLEEGSSSIGELAEHCGGSSGPVALVLRAALILGFVSYDSNSRKYSLKTGADLSELKELLTPERGICGILKRIYRECIPPFALDSEPAAFLLDVWASQRSLWSEARHKGIALLFDGIVLTPLLASAAFLSRWDEAGNEIADNDESVSFKRCPRLDLQTFRDLIKELDLGEVGNTSVLKLKPEVLNDWRRIYDYFIPAAHARLLGEFAYILADNASWGYIEQPEDDKEKEDECMNKPLLSKGLTWQSQPYHRELLNHIYKVFSGHDFHRQPQYIVDIQSADGSLLALVYDFIKTETPRGDNLKKHPLTIIAMSDDEECRIKASSVFMAKNLPNKVIKGNLSDPITAAKSLQRFKIDPRTVLHVRAFADHTRAYIPPRKKIAKDSVAAEFAKSVLSETIHLDKYGNQIAPVNIFASLVEHLERTAIAAQGTAGICMVDVMQMNTQSIQKFFNDSSAFHTELLQSLSRQYVVPAVAFHMASGMAGLLPEFPKTVSTYPKDGKYVRMICQHAVPQEFKIRFAEPSDIDKLMELEAHAWAEHLRAPREGLLTRLKTSPTSCFVVTISDEVVAVLYTQRIPSLEVIFEERFQEVWKAHDPKGSIIQLIAINVNPSVGHLGLAQHLRAFALRFAQLEPSIKSVCAVTICREFKKYSGTMEAYMDEHVSKTLPGGVDPVVDFHTGYGAQFISLVPGYRPEDVDNQGFGILIHYHLPEVFKPPPPLSSLKKTSKSQAQAETAIQAKETALQKTSTLDLIKPIMQENGIEVNDETMGQSLFAQGMDSLELVQIRNKLASDLGLELTSTFLLDYPTLELVCARIDEMRGTLKQQQAKEREPREAPRPKKEKRRKEVPQETRVQEPKENVDIDEIVPYSDTSDVDSEHGFKKLTVLTLIDYLHACKKQYSTASSQKMFKDVAQSCYPNMLKYILAVEPVLCQIQKPILREQGLIEDDDYITVQAARAHVASMIASSWAGKQEVRKLVAELTTLAKLDQKW